jgi:amino acid transporter
MDEDGPRDDRDFSARLRRRIFGKPQDINDPGIFHKLALIPIFAWIGLGADGLSSSSYGPEEAFRALGSHMYLAVFLALATALTVFIISYTYTRIIEKFPNGGGGYIVATTMLGEKAGLVSGGALIVDYILTITVSITSCADAIFSYLPPEFQKWKIVFAAIMIIMLVMLNLRGIKESITTLAPIFAVFLVSHIVLLGVGIFGNLGAIAPLARQVHANLGTDLSGIGLMGMLMLFLRAYSLGGGTYTGIEAVSNGMQIMKEPRIRTGKRTMVYLASSLAITAGGLFLCYLLSGITPSSGRTLNAILADKLFGGSSFGAGFAFITILSEGALLLVGAQAGFIDAPRVMANMAVDSWFPHRFSHFSERLTMRNGIIIIGASALVLLIYTGGSISALIVMYSINVFLTFSISEFAMVRYFFRNRKAESHWLKRFLVQLAGLVLCLAILMVTIVEKFTEGGWITLLITAVLVFFCYRVRLHYRGIAKEMKSFDILMKTLPTENPPRDVAVDPEWMTAIQLVSRFNGFGVHSLYSIVRAFPGFYRNIIFVSVAIVDQGMFKGAEGLGDLKLETEKSLAKYVQLGRRLGFAADYRMGVGTDVVDTVTDICTKTVIEFPHSTVFSGKLLFRHEHFYHRILHNETAYAVQRRLQWDGITTVILPVRME